MKTFDPTKPVQTRDGRKARILTTQGKAKWSNKPQPIVAEVENKDNVSYNTYTPEGCFYDLNTPDSTDLINIPEAPKLRAWKAKEVPVGAVVSFHGEEASYLIGCQNGYSVSLCGRGGLSFEELMEKCEHSTDGGKTWHACGVLES